MINDKKPNTDFSNQSKFTNCDLAEQRLIYKLHLMGEHMITEEKLGAIVVFGDFLKDDCVVDGIVQMKPKENPVDEFLTIDSAGSVRFMVKFSSAPYDGAIIVDRSGQIIGAGVYLVVENPTIEIPDGCGTRHKAAASFSLRDDVISVLTISEETGIMRRWTNGVSQEINKNPEEMNGENSI